MKLEYEHVKKMNNSSFFVQNFKGNSFPAPYHLHEECEIVLINSGRGRIVVGDFSDRFDDRSLYIFGPNLPHTFFSDSSFEKENLTSESHYIQFKVDCFGMDFFKQKEFQGFNSLLQNSNRGLIFSGFDYIHAEQLFKKIQNISPLLKISTFIEIQDLLVNCESSKQLATEQYTRIESHHESVRINRSIDMIERNYSRQITLQEVADVAHLSPAAFSRFFKKNMNLSFIDYLIELRLSEACRLLLESDLPITDIALDVGFKNLSNFNRQFLKRRSISPRRFRQGEHSS